MSSWQLQSFDQMLKAFFIQNVDACKFDASAHDATYTAVAMYSRKTFLENLVLVFFLDHTSIYIHCATETFLEWKLSKP